MLGAANGTEAPSFAALAIAVVNTEMFPHKLGMARDERSFNLAAHLRNSFSPTQWRCRFCTDRTNPRIFCPVKRRRLTPEASQAD